MVIRPSAPSIILNNASVNEDFPAPVRPTTPIYNAQRLILKKMCGISISCGLLGIVVIICLSLVNTMYKISILDGCLFPEKHCCLRVC